MNEAPTDMNGCLGTLDQRAPWSAALAASFRALNRSEISLKWLRMLQMILTSLYHIVRLHTIIDEAFGGSAGTQQEKPKAG